MFWRRRTKTQVPPLELNNETSSVVEVQVEVYPDRYVLKPGDKMTIEADQRGAPFTVNVHDGGLQIFPGNTAGAVVTINGATAQPDWTTEI